MVSRRRRILAKKQIRAGVLANAGGSRNNRAVRPPFCESGDVVSDTGDRTGERMNYVPQEKDPQQCRRSRSDR